MAKAAKKATRVSTKTVKRPAKQQAMFVEEESSATANGDSTDEIAALISQNLRNLAARLGKSGNQIAAELGCSPAIWNRYVVGNRIPTIDSMLAIAKRFDVPFAELVKGIDGCRPQPTWRKK